MAGRATGGVGGHQCRAVFGQREAQGEWWGVRERPRGSGGG